MAQALLQPVQQCTDHRVLSTMPLKLRQTIGQRMRKYYAKALRKQKRVNDRRYGPLAMDADFGAPFTLVTSCGSALTVHSASELAAALLVLQLKDPIPLQVGKSFRGRSCFSLPLWCFFERTMSASSAVFYQSIFS